MATTASMTLAEFAALPDQPGKQELIKGELVCVPPPKSRHSLTQSSLVELLSIYARRRGGARVFTDTGFQLSDDTCVEPDVAYALDAQIAAAGPDDWFQGAPVLAIEILSPSNRASVMDDKVQAYLAAGAQAVWVVNPLRQRVSAYCAGRFEILEMPDGVLTCDAFPGLEIPLSAIFA